ncbi:hypothetical protein [Bifidobacterium adolescentis]|uniref:hypothetical protein n=1 Tax=Bifidobacterium adolescentis TaxID=1680 RepID=UPI003BB59140
MQLVNGFYLNGKVLELMDECPAAVARFCMILSFCGDNLTDGYVSRRDMRYVLRATDEELRLLLMENMLEEVDEGYVVHDYTEHNRSREQVLRSRKKTAERVARHRENDDVTALHASRNGATSQKHQNTRTPKKEKEEYSSSFSKEMTLAMFQGSRELAAANSMMRATYPNLDLKNSWDAFATRQYDATRMVGDWTRLWKGWCQRRAKMSGIPPSKPHKHTWKCSHVLEALGRDEETAQADEKACELADRLNKEKS